MRKPVVRGVAAGLMAVGAAACSSSPAASHDPGVLPSGTAQVTINDARASETHTVNCTSIGPLTTIAAGTSAAGVTAIVSSKNGLNAQTVSIQDLGGFTGSFMEGLQGQAQATMSDQTYTIRGTANGFATDNPSATTTATFAIKIAC